MKKRKGILLVNLGTPDSPSVKDVRKYLIEFLTDPRVIDVPFLQRQFLVRGIIAPFRAPKSAKLYAELWTNEGSPLLVYGNKIKQLLQEKLGEEYHVELAMRYGNPSIKSVINRLKSSDLINLKIIPLFPQYAEATAGSVIAEVESCMQTWDARPDYEYVNEFFVQEDMIKAFAEIAGSYTPDNYDHVLFSFHGLPERQLMKSDSGNHCVQSEDCCYVMSDKNKFCYGAQCYSTAHAIIKAMEIAPGKYSIGFQSRLGRTPWKKPYTIDIIKSLAAKNIKNILVLCPSFVCDCLETTIEIGKEYKDAFLEAGGEKLQLVEGLNDYPTWVNALSKIAK